MLSGAIVGIELYFSIKNPPDSTLKDF